MNRREFLKAVPAMAALAATASSLADDLVPASSTQAASTSPQPAGADAAASGPAVRLEPITLLKPQADGGKSVLAALVDRKTIRTISEKPLPPKVLSNLLWAAFGVNREKGPGGGTGRTAASASNSQEIDIYVALPEGVYLYEAVPHRLTPVVEGDLRAKVGRRRRGRGANAPVRLVYVVDIAKYAKARFQEPGDPEVLLLRGHGSDRRQRVPVRRVARLGCLVPQLRQGGPCQGPASETRSTRAFCPDRGISGVGLASAPCGWNAYR